MIEEVLFFSNNKKKIIEISSLFSNESIKVLNLNNFNKIKSPEEVGKTFEENAKIKALHGFDTFKKKCFADDSGICIQAMGGDPGVLSKKFLEKEGGIKKNLEEILLISKNKNDFNAFFQTSICLVLDKYNHVFFKGKIKGKVSQKIRGFNGFGYDPIFIPERENKTFAEMSLKEKNTISHRYIAIEKLKSYLINLI
jgi:XTP/dITP diphosphohydrolase